MIAIRWGLQKLRSWFLCVSWFWRFKFFVFRFSFSAASVICDVLFSFSCFFSCYWIKFVLIYLWFWWKCRISMKTFLRSWTSMERLRAWMFVTILLTTWWILVILDILWVFHYIYFFCISFQTWYIMPLLL